MSPNKVVQSQNIQQKKEEEQTMMAQAHQDKQQNPAASEDHKRILWVGDLGRVMDERFLFNYFSYTGEVVSTKVIRNKCTGQPEGYGFVEFATHAMAETVLRGFNVVSENPRTQPIFRLNWALERSEDMWPDHSIFVGDLEPGVTDNMLKETFRARYSSVRHAIVVKNRNTGLSKGYGFVRFANEKEQKRSLNEMNGEFCAGRAMRIGIAAPKKDFAQLASDSDPNNTTLFVSGLDESLTYEALREVFGQHGEVEYVNIFAGKRSGFVRFSRKSSAQQALQSLNGTVIGDRAVTISWRRNNQMQLNGSGHGHGQGYPGGVCANFWQPLDQRQWPSDSNYG